MLSHSYKETLKVQTKGISYTKHLNVSSTLESSLYKKFCDQIRQQSHRRVRIATMIERVSSTYKFRDTIIRLTEIKLYDYMTPPERHLKPQGSKGSLTKSAIFVVSRWNKEHIRNWISSKSE